MVTTSKLTPWRSVLFMTIVSVPWTPTMAEYATSENPLAFGPDQTIIDIAKVTWGPLELPGFAPGAEVALLRGDLATASELVIRVPPGYIIPNHTHTSAETYIGLAGEYVYVDGEGGRSAAMSGHSFISLPGNAPPHAIICGESPCLFYLRFPRPFDHRLFPMPEEIVPVE